MISEVMASAAGGPGNAGRRLGSLWTGVGAQLARDVPFSAICWASLEPTRREFLRLAGEEPGMGAVLASNFSAGVLAGGFAAGVTCPLDVAKTMRQIEMDPIKGAQMTTLGTLKDVYREGGTRALFLGVGPRVARAGPSIGAIVSFYELAKIWLQH